MSDSSMFTAAQASDPSTPQAVLADIARDRPDLRAAVASNPSAYPALIDWLSGLGDPAIDAAIAGRGASATAPMPPSPAAPAPAYQPAQPDYGQQGQPIQAAPAWEPQQPKKSGLSTGAIVGIVVGIVVLLGLLIGGFFLVMGLVNTVGGSDGSYGDDAYLDGLWDDCAAGDMQACDDLYDESPIGSEYESFGDTCGGLQDEGTFVYCTEAFGSGTDGSTTSDADAYGDDAYLDGLWDACDAGDNQACDDLYAESPFGSEYETFGDTCGGRNPDGGEYCTDVFGSGTDGSTTSDVNSYGDDAYLDGLWDACDAGDNQACDDLYAESPFGSEYETFGDTCAGRNPEGGIYCTDLD